MPTTLSISLLSFLMGFVTGLPLAFARVYGGRVPSILVDLFEKTLRGVPEIVTMLFLYYGIGLVLGVGPFGDPLFAATFALGLRSGAHQSQIFRGAIRGVGEEQMVAARSLGLTRLQSIIHVIAPQTFIVAAPSLGSEYALLVKDSAYAFILGVLEVMKKTDIVRRTSYDMVFPYFAAALLYILLTFPITTYLDTWAGRRKRKLGL